MPSPFPGMDPFLEYHWGDVHLTLTAGTRNQLKGQLPPDLRARVEEYHTLEVFDDEQEDLESNPRNSSRKPDVRVVETVLPQQQHATAAQTIKPAMPYRVSIEPETYRRIVIVDRRNERLVTTIEFLSTANKTGKDRESFLNKQLSFWEAGVNVVEVDLLRRGGWAVSIEEDKLPEACRYPYRIVVKAGAYEGLAYATSIREPLPAIAIPLRNGDPDAILDLQSLITQAWDDGTYDDIDYAREPLPPFNPEDVQWINALLSGKGFDRSQAKQTKT